MSVNQDNLYPTELHGTLDIRLGLGFPSQHLCQSRSLVDWQAINRFLIVDLPRAETFAGQLDIYALMTIWCSRIDYCLVFMVWLNVS